MALHVGLVWAAAVMLCFHCSPASLLNSTSSCDIQNDIGLYWINLEKSVERKRHMQKQLKYYGLDARNRVRAYTPNHIYIPEFLMQPADCNTLGEEGLKQSFQMYPVRKQQRFIVKSLCGRKKNSMKDLAVTLSHLWAIRTAIYDEKQQHNNYALILEDDLQFSFGIHTIHTISTISTIYTLPSIHAIHTLRTIHTIHTLLCIHTIPHYTGGII